MGVELSDKQRAALRVVLAASGTRAEVAARARIVLVRGQGCSRGEVAQRCGVSLPTVDRWVSRFLEHGVDGLAGRSRARARVPEHVRRRVVQLAACAPPTDSGVACWSTRALADFISRTGELTVSSNYVATVLREAGVRLPASPEQQTRRGRQPEPLDVRVEFVVVQGPPAPALRERQSEAIGAILRWLREHPE